MDHNLLKACKPLVVNEFWKDLDRLLDTFISAEIQILTNSIDIGAIREAQGKIKAYKNLRALPDTIRSVSN